ncbi:MAG: CocE/NonD family hydrolase [Micromonosporaceae bacterium]|nr:CocE/NonD family hydrolase [Micromonosporaceae bacterium]
MLTRSSYPLAAATVVAALVAGQIAITEANRDPAGQQPAAALAPSAAAGPDPAGAAPPGGPGEGPEPAAPPPAAEPVVRELAIEVSVGPADDRRVCTVVTDLYLPPAAGPDHRVPAILTTHGFGGSKQDQQGIGLAAARQGYAVLAYSGLGFGGSDCKIYIDDPQYDGLAGSQLIDFLAGAHEAVDGTRLDAVALDAPGDPRVGMVGGSYGGQIQFAIMAVDQRLDALVPLITWNDLGYSLTPNNTGFQTGVSSGEPGVFKRGWAGLFTGVGVLRGAEHAQSDPSRLAGCPNFRDEVCASLARVAVLGYPDDQTAAWTRQVSVASYLDRITAPTLLIQGQADTLFGLQEAIATHRELTRRGTPVRMIWSQFGHSGNGPTGEIDLSADRIATSYLGQQAMAWFDHWLKGDGSVPPGPPLTYFREWAYHDPGDDADPAAHLAAVTAAYGTAGRYPVGRTQPLYLSGDGALVTAPGAVAAGSQSYLSPVAAPGSYSEVPAVQGELDEVPPTDAPGTFAAWTTAPLARSVDTVGVPTVEVTFNTPTAAGAPDEAGRLVVFAKLYDVAPDGTQTLKHRLVSPVRVPDATAPVRIELPGIVHRWEAGHRIRVVLAGSDLAYAGNLVAHPVTIATDLRQPPVLRLPVLHRPVLGQD